MISDDKAIEIAQATCEFHDDPFTPRIQVIHYLFRQRITVRTHADLRCPAIYVDIHPDTGRVLRYARLGRWERDLQLTSTGEPSDDRENPVLVPGETVRVHGLYTAHRDESRFEYRRRGRLRWRRVPCLLEPRESIAPSVADAAGVSEPEDWRYLPPLYFDVVADVTPMECGHFGHLGMLRWRLRVEEWVAVSRLPRRPRR